MDCCSTRRHCRCGIAIRLVVVAVAAGLVLTACVTGGDAPVRSPGEASVHKGFYKVKAGDTLYSIAWGAGLDYRSVARWNGIGAPYLIKPGQRVSLMPPRRNRSHPPNPAAAPRSGRSRSRPPASGWAWPAKGKLLYGFSLKKGRTGIEIGGYYGQPIRSAAAGQVVYAGSGLRGYGKLIIVKHNETFLSAYAHNRKLLVREGSRVTTGQRIAEMGNTGTTKVKLHFEIRRHGAPVDPLRYLPRRGR
jgi:lipoprotein NlpD